MQVVIDIPDIFLEWAKDEMSVEIFDNRSMADTMSSAIRNGIVIQSGHGDLIDRDTFDAEAKAYTYDAPIVVPKKGVTQNE